MIGHRLAYYRHRSGLRQNEAARFMGISAKYLGNVERGHERPSQRLIDEATRLYGIDAQDIIAEHELSQDEEALIAAFRKGDKLEAIAIVMAKSA